MFQSSLQTPKVGRSRFSKALPAPPPPDTMSSRTTAPVITPSSSTSPLSRTKELPAVPPPPPKDDRQASSKPLKAQLPPLPLMAPLAPIGLPKSPRAPPPTSIPRRPVAKPPVVVPEPSPTGSLSSLLSAYSRSSGESLIRSSDGGASTKEGSELTLSPTQEDMDGKKADMSPPMAKGGFTRLEVDIPRFEMTHERAPTVNPTKTEVQRPGTPQGEKSAKGTETDTSAQQPTSPSSPQIWRRRSLKSYQNLEVTDLKLQTSHGSTAGSQSQSQIKPGYSASPFTSTQNSPARPLQPPFSAYGLPGRDIRPAASRDRLQRQEQQPEQRPEERPEPPKQQEPQETETMGAKVSRLKEKFQAHVENSSVSQFPPRSTSRNQNSLKQPRQNRPPTPEYAKNEVQLAVVDTIVSPVSPASSPEPSKDEQKGEPAAPQQQQVERQPISRKVLPATKDLHAARSLPEMRSPVVPQTSSEQPPPVPNEHATSAPKDAPNQAGRAEAAPSREQQGEQNYKFPPRTSSTRVPPRQHPLNSPASMQDMRPGSRGQGQYQAYQPGLSTFEDAPPMVRRRPEQTVYHEVNQDDLPPPDPRAAYFPLKNEQGEPMNAPPSPSTIFRAPKLTHTHYECYARHTQMVVSRNKLYSLSCQACNVEDSETRWQCAWCRLRVCGRCVRTLQKVDRDLARLLDYVEKNPPGSGGSSRPSTGNGALQRVEEAPETERSAEHTAAAEPARVQQ